MDLVAISAGIVISGALLAVAAVALRHREQPGALAFVALTVFLAAMMGTITLYRMDLLSLLWLDVGIIVTFFSALVAWIVLAFEYTGRGPVMTARRIAGLSGVSLCIFGGIGLLFVVPERFFPAIWIVMGILQVSLVAAAGYGTFLVARSSISYDDLPLSESLVLATAGGGITAVTVIMILIPILPYETGLDALQVLFAGIAGLLLLTQVRYRVFETGPSAGHLAREAVLDEMSASAAITNRDHRLLDLNRTAESTFDVEPSEALGEPIDEVFGVDPDRRVETPASLETGDGRRQFDVEHLELEGRSGDAIGRAYLLEDVTNRRTHEQQLDVLNRVLRHNLRNDLDAIRGFAEALERDGDHVDPDAVAERIHATASDLADLGKTIALAEQLLARDALDADAVDVVTLAHRIATDHEGTNPDTTITVSASDPTVELETDRPLLETVLSEVVENALEHNDVTDPRVAIELSSDGSEALIEVRDNGPGIPDRELAVLLNGEEQPLRHGSGLGLWLVSWGVVRLGGDLEFRANEPRGSIVSIRIPSR